MTGNNRAVSVKKADYIVCPKCSYPIWSTSLKRYGRSGHVYCSQKDCQHKFVPKVIKKDEYSLYLFTADIDEAISIMEQSLKTLKEKKGE